MTNKTLLTMLTFGISAFAAGAQDAGAGSAGGDSGNRPPPPPIIAVLDLNRDGVIDGYEIASCPVSLLSLDKNMDGRLTADEYQPPPRGGGGRDSAAAPLPSALKALVGDGDGAIETGAIINCAVALKSLDKNGDDKLTPDEFMGPPPRQ